MVGWVKRAGGSLGLVGDFHNENISSIPHLLFAIIHHIYLSHFQVGAASLAASFFGRKALPGGEVKMRIPANKPNTSI